MRPSEIVTRIRAALGPHLVKCSYLKHRPKNATASWGCCYVATEAFYHLWGKEQGFTPMYVSYQLSPTETGRHWFLEHRPSGLILDITADQFPNGKVPSYENATAAGFLTKKPSKRAQQIIDAVLKPE